jgi:hypothetical protein
MKRLTIWVCFGLLGVVASSAGIGPSDWQLYAILSLLLTIVLTAEFAK